MRAAVLDCDSPGGRVVVLGWSSGSMLELALPDLLQLGITASVAVVPRMPGRPDLLLELSNRALAVAARGHRMPVVLHP